MPASKFPTGL